MLYSHPKWDLHRIWDGPCGSENARLGLFIILPMALVRLCRKLRERVPVTVRCVASSLHALALQVARTRTCDCALFCMRLACACAASYTNACLGLRTVWHMLAVTAYYAAVALAHVYEVRAQLSLSSARRHQQRAQQRHCHSAPGPAQCQAEILPACAMPSRAPPARAMVAPSLRAQWCAACSRDGFSLRAQWCAACSRDGCPRHAQSCAACSRDGCPLRAQSLRRLLAQWFLAPCPVARQLGRAHHALSSRSLAGNTLPDGNSRATRSSAIASSSAVSSVPSRRVLFGYDLALRRECG